MRQQTHFQTGSIPVVLMTLIFIEMLMLPVTVVNAVPNDSSDYRCDKIDSSKTIGQVECCDVDLTDAEIYCTICDATNPPSNCSDRYKQIQYKELPSKETRQFVPSLNAERGPLMEHLSDHELKQLQQSENKGSGMSNLEGELSYNSGLEETNFNTLQENDDSNEEGNNNTTS